MFPLSLTQFSSFSSFRYLAVSSGKIIRTLTYIITGPLRRIALSPVPTGVGIAWIEWRGLFSWCSGWFRCYSASSCCNGSLSFCSGPFSCRSWFSSWTWRLNSTTFCTFRFYFIDVIMMRLSDTLSKAIIITIFIIWTMSPAFIRRWWVEQVRGMDTRPTLAVVLQTKITIAILLCNLSTFACHVP